MTGRLRPRDVTAALRGLYPGAPITTKVLGPGELIVTIPASAARYWGVYRDPARAAAWLSHELRAPLAVTAAGPRRGGPSGPLVADVQVSLCDGPLPPDPGSGRGMPDYATTAQVLGDFPASREVTALVQLAIDAGCRPHLDWARSPRECGHLNWPRSGLVSS